MTEPEPHLSAVAGSSRGSTVPTPSVDTDRVVIACDGGTLTPGWTPPSGLRAGWRNCAW